MDLTYIVMDNEVYGMTKGQASPTTQPDWATASSRPTAPACAASSPRPSRWRLARASSPAASPATRTASPELLTAAIEHRGFSFVHVLSPCRTFRPEQQEWKQLVHPCRMEPTHDAAHAAQLIQRDDGMALGLLFQQDIPIYSPAATGAGPTASLADIEAELRR
jgi:2-oxoglutarate ferredoxin oxidoreductase subunit beta